MLVRKLKIRRGASAGGFQTSYVPATAVLVCRPSLRPSRPALRRRSRQRPSRHHHPLPADGHGAGTAYRYPNDEALTITERVPTITASLHRLVIPGSKALLLTPNAPTVNGSVGVIVPNGR